MSNYLGDVGHHYSSVLDPGVRAGAVSRQQQFETTYGAASSLVIILAWVYYAAQILFFAVQVTQVCQKIRLQIVPLECRALTDETRAEDEAQSELIR